MADVQVIAEPTPNPNSVKFTLDRPVTQGRGATYRTPEEAADAPLLPRARVPGETNGPPGVAVILTWEESSPTTMSSVLHADAPGTESWRDVLRGKFLLGGGTAARLAALIWDEAPREDEGADGRSIRPGRRAEG